MGRFLGAVAAALLLVGVVPAVAQAAEPATVVTSVTPGSRGAGGTSLPVTIRGGGFAPGAVVAVSGTGVTVDSATVLDPTRIDAVVSVDVLAAPGTRSVTVDGGTPCACFVVNAAPTPSSTSPSSRSQGAPTTAVDVFGTGFHGASVSFGAGVHVVGSPVVTATRLTVQVAVDADAAPGVRTVVVTNADGGRDTCECFGVTARPSLLTVAPARGRAGEPVEVTVRGTGFRAGPTVSFGAGATVTDLVEQGSDTLVATVALAVDAARGLRDVRVDNRDGGSAVCAACFTVTTAPVLASAAPAARGQGAPATPLTVRGTDLGPGAVLSVPSGSGVTVGPTTYVDATTLTASVAVAADAATGPVPVTVVNGDGATATCSCFAVTAAPYVVALDPNVVQRNRSGRQMRVTGGNFAPGLTVEIGDGVTVGAVEVVSPKELALTFDVAADAPLGRHPIVVRNADGGTGGCTVCLVVSSARLFTLDAAANAESGAAQTVTLTAHTNSNPDSPADTSYAGTPVLTATLDTHFAAGTCTAAVDGVSTCTGVVFGDLGPAVLAAADGDVTGTLAVTVRPVRLEWAAPPPATANVGEIVRYAVRPVVGVDGASDARYQAVRRVVVDGDGVQPASGSVLGCPEPSCTFPVLFTQPGGRTVSVTDSSSPATPPAPIDLRYPTRISLALSRSAAAVGEEVVLAGRLDRTVDGSAVWGASVRIYGRVWPSTAYRLLRTVPTGSDGRYRTAFRMEWHTVFQAVFVPARPYLFSESAKLLVTVRGTVAAGAGWARGRTLVVQGYARPAAAGALVYLVWKRPDGRTAALAVTRLDRYGRFRLERARLARGTYNVYVLVAGSCCTVSGTSRVLTVRAP